MSDWRYVLSQNRPTLLAFVFFVVMFAIYSSNHPAGFSANVVQTAANKGVLLALVAMAQTFVVITAGIDLSVGAVFVLTNCLASWIVVGTAATAALGVIGVLLTGLVCGAINGLVVIVGRLQPIVATIATGAVFFGLALVLRPTPGGDVYGPLADALTGRAFSVLPASLVALAAVVARRLGSLPAVRRSGGRPMPSAPRSRPPICRASRSTGRNSAPTRCPASLASMAGLFPDLRHLFGRSFVRQRRNLHALFDRGGRARRRLAVTAARAARSARFSAR